MACHLASTTHDNSDAGDDRRWEAEEFGEAAVEVRARLAVVQVGVGEERFPR